MWDIVIIYHTSWEISRLPIISDVVGIRTINFWKLVKMRFLQHTTPSTFILIQPGGGGEGYISPPPKSCENDKIKKSSWSLLTLTLRSTMVVKRKVCVSFLIPFILNNSPILMKLGMNMWSVITFHKILNFNDLTLLYPHCSQPTSSISSYNYVLNSLSIRLTAMGKFLHI